uniref:Uncharacterized protein n=1 Tax=Solanum tuberosum TaxID=4113 RepID=M1DYJ5_SOLTU
MGMKIEVSKQAKNEESTRPKSKFLELKPFESSSSSKPYPNLELKTDHSVTLVEIADQLSYSPFGVVHRRLALVFSIVMFWIIRRPSTASRNFSVTHRLLLFNTDFILSFRAQHFGIKSEPALAWHTRTLGSQVAIQQLVKWTWRSPVDTINGEDLRSMVPPTDCPGRPSFGIRDSIIESQTTDHFLWTVVQEAGRGSRPSFFTCDSGISLSLGHTYKNVSTARGLDDGLSW